ncbi:MAG: NAD(P)-binding domain-containing protein [Candidatus Omnitrophica bacterium]|nr:NAD(P)-binding domain-containing protein [Candidatus Omnitrophota bacterium]
MPDNELIKIQISKVIPAQKWRVIRLLTKIQEFPSYIPCVKEATVIHKKHNIMRTKWRVQIEGVPISWIEEDTLALNEKVIYFHATEGDLAEFKGKWEFLDHPLGTEVKVEVFLKVGIPSVNEAVDANNYIKKLLSKNFEAILDAVERRLISIKYSSYKSGENEKIAGFGIIAHLYNFFHLEKCLKTLNPGLKMPSREFISQLYHVSPSFKLCDIDNFKSKTGAIASGSVILATFIPDMMEKDLFAVSSKIFKACKIAEKTGMGIVSLTGFTSIVPERIGQRIADEVDVPVTTGNAFTAAMVIDGVLKAARRLNLDMDKVNMAIIGGTGNIGSICARIMAKKVKQLTITARTRENLKKTGAELKKLKKAKIIATDDNQAAIKNADIVICCASSSASFLDISWFKTESIVCDLGYPKNVAYTSHRDDIFLFSGGLAKSPTPIVFPVDLGLPTANTLYGSFAESIILALEKRYEAFSPEQGQITPEKVEEIRILGKKHGFEVSDFYWDGELLKRS